jgi:hypothetical protein
MPQPLLEPVKTQKQLASLYLPASLRQVIASNQPIAPQQQQRVGHKAKLQKIIEHAHKEQRA